MRKPFDSAEAITKRWNRNVFKRVWFDERRKSTRFVTEISFLFWKTWFFWIKQIVSHPPAITSFEVRRLLQRSIVVGIIEITFDTRGSNSRHCHLVILSEDNDCHPHLMKTLRMEGFSNKDCKDIFKEVRDWAEIGHSPYNGFVFSLSSNNEVIVTPAI